MRRRVLLLVFLATTLSAQRAQIDPAIAPGFDSIRAAEMRADLAFLTSRPLAGRMSLERGSDVTIEWIAAEFAKAGLQPANEGSFLQPVQLIEYHPDLKGMGLSLEAAGQRTDFQYAQDFIGSFPENITVRGAAVFAGFGITAPEFAYDDYTGVDAYGKIVVIFDHEPQEADPRSVFNGIGNTRHANARLKVLNAQKHGAIGVIVVVEPNRKHPSNIERQQRVPGYGARLTKYPSQALVDSPVKIPMFVVLDRTAKAIFAAAGKNASALQTQIDTTLQPAATALPGVRLEMRVVNTDRRQGTSANVVGMIEGSDARLKDETIIYSAHFDHDGVRDNLIYPGADDNASGTVAVVELARAFNANKVRPKRTLLFVAFAAEERGLLGSYYYVEHPLRPLAATRAVINFDMIGRNETPSTQTENLRKIAPDTTNQLSLIGTIHSPGFRAVVEKQNRNIGLVLDETWDEDAALNVYQRSDHFPFAVHDIPAIWWFTGFHPDYHQPTDTIEKINLPKMERVVKLAYLTGWAWASGAAPPPKFNATVKP